MRKADRGQATVELALALPLVCLLVLGLVQIALVGRGQLAVQHAAHEGARAAAVSADPVEAATSAAQRAIALRPLDVQVVIGDALVTVTVSYRDHTDVALVGGLLPDLALRATATMAFEPPAG